MKAAVALWQMKPVQTGAKALGAGIVAAASVWAYRAATTSISGPTDANYKMLLSEMPKHSERLKELWESRDRDWIDILGRLETFRRFAVSEFDDIFVAVSDAFREKRDCYSRKLHATDSFRIRASYQKIIESVRILRSIVEYTIESAVEDFDEIAVDLNAKVEQAASDAIQDTV